MSVRLLLCVFALLALLGLTVFLLESEASPVGEAAPRPSPGRVAEPDVGGGSALEGLLEQVSKPEQLSAAQEPGPTEGEIAPNLAIPADGWVTGKVVDPSGTALVGVPVLLYVVNDPWQDELEDGELSVKTGGARTGPDGGFRMPARSGCRHALLAGGLEWARVRVDHVAASDELLVSLQDPRWVEGVVQTEEGGELLEEARVLVLGDAESVAGVTDADGAFHLSPLPFESVTVAAWAPGHGVAIATEVLPGWEPLELTLPAGTDITGQVLERENKQPLAGAEVRFRMDVEARALGSESAGPSELESRSETVFEQSVVTDEEGRFLLEAMPTSGFVLEVAAEGYVPRRMAHYENRPLADEEEVVVYLQPLEQVFGHVAIGIDEQRVEAAALQLLAGGEVLARATADASGAFAFTLEDWDGQAALRVAATNDDGWRGLARVRSRKSDEAVIVRLAEPVPLELVVTSDGELLVGAQVAVQSGTGPDERSLVTTGAGGRASLVHARSSPDVDRLFVQARYGGEQSLPVEVDLADGLPTEAVTLDIQTGVWLEGRVQDPFGVPIPGASVWERRSMAVHSDAEGRFRLGPFEEGAKARVEAVAKGYRQQREVVPQLSDWVGEMVITLEPIVSWEGTVLDSATGLPVEDFLARLEQERETKKGLEFKEIQAQVERAPDAPGAFSAELPGTGRYRIKVMSLDYVETRSAAVQFDGASAPPAVQVYISPAAVLRVTVTDTAGTPIPGFSVRVVEELPADSSAKQRKKLRRKGPSRRTDSKGFAGFNLGEGGVYRLASGNSGWLEEQPLSVRPGPAIERSYRLPATGDLVLEITDEYGDPVKRPRVTVRTIGSDRVYEVLRRSSPRGTPEQVVFDVLPPGEYSLSVRAKGYDSYKGTSFVISSRVQREGVVLLPAGTSDSKKKAGTSRGRKR